MTAYFVWMGSESTSSSSQRRGHAETNGRRPYNATTHDIDDINDWVTDNTIKLNDNREDQLTGV